jgi:hypothetical protein
MCNNRGMYKLLVLADDLTGALDTGVQFVKNGVVTRVILSPPLPGGTNEAGGGEDTAELKKIKPR